MVHEPFISILVPDGLAKGADDVLFGDLDIPVCIHPDIIEVLKFMKMDDKIMNSDQVRIDTRFKEFCDFWKPKREKIQSSMSLIHNGHYIASTANASIGMVNSFLSSVPWEMGYTLERWLKSLNVALEKLPGIRHLSRLQKIHLLEADYNTGRKHIFSNCAMYNAMVHKQIPESQYMKRHSSAIEAVILKRIFFALCRIYKS